MKALNRAIARTTGDITNLCAFHIDQLGTQGCAVKQTPETLKQLEQHLAALLEMERKQLEQVPGKLVAFSTPQERNGSLFDRFVANGMMEQDAFRDSGEARKLGITPARIMAQMHPGEGGTMAALEKACEAASNFASEGARYLQQRDDALAVLKDALDSLEYVEKHMPGMNGFMVRQERIARAKTVIANIKGGTASEQPQLPAYQVGDMLERVRHGNKQWTVGKLYEIQKVDGESFQLLGDDGRPYWTTQDNLNFSNRGKVVPPAPDVIDMTDPRNWQVGDVLMCSDGNAFLGINAGDECAVVENNETYVVVRRNSGTAVALHHDKPTESAFFTWLRHSEEAPATNDAKDMTDPATWQEGDIVLRTGHDWAGFVSGNEYRVGKVNALKQEIYINRNEGNTTGYTFALLREDKMFTWLRHGEAQQ